MFDRRGFIKRGLLFLPTIFIPRIGVNPVVVELFNPGGSEVFHLPRRGMGLQAASTIKQRTISSVVDNRIRLTNSNFARLWSSDVGTTWSQIRVCGRLSIEDTGANLTSTPKLNFGICSGTSNIYMDATTTHWAGFETAQATWTRYTTPAKYDMSFYNGGLLAVKRIGSTRTSGGGIFWSTGPAGQGFIADCTVASRRVFILDITKGSPNFTFKVFGWDANTGNGAMADCTVETFLAQIPLTSPSITNHSFSDTKTIALDEATNGYFNAVNIAWDRTSPAIELSDLAVVKLA